MTEQTIIPQSKWLDIVNCVKFIFEVGCLVAIFIAGMVAGHYHGKSVVYEQVYGKGSIMLDAEAPLPLPPKGKK